MQIQPLAYSSVLQGLHRASTRLNDAVKASANPDGVDLLDLTVAMRSRQTEHLAQIKVLETLLEIDRSILDIKA